VLEEWLRAHQGALPAHKAATPHAEPAAALS
jgi:hypothetical protein